MSALSPAVAPLLDASFADARDIPGVVRAIAGPRGLGGAAGPAAANALDLIGADLAEALQSIVEQSGPQDPDRAAVELCVEPTLMVLVVRFAGPPLPDWLISNRNRGDVPAVLAAPGASGWGWLTVREVMESASQQRARRGNLLFLENWP